MALKNRYLEAGCVDGSVAVEQHHSVAAMVLLVNNQWKQMCLFLSENIKSLLVVVVGCCHNDTRWI